MRNYLIHVGYPKSGSCFLGEWFHRHPSFIFKDFKIAGLDSTEDLCQHAISNGSGKKYFVVRDMRFSCPIIEEVNGFNNIEEYQKNICSTLNSLFPNSKVLIVTRGFESAIKSNHVQYIKEGGVYTLRTLIENNLDSKWITYNYSYLINLYRNSFGPENVIVIPYELLKDSKKDFLKQIEDNLEIPSIKDEIGVINESLPLKTVSALRKINIIINNISKHTGRPGKFLLKTYLKSLDSKKTARNNKFILSRIFSFFYNKQEDNEIPYDLIPQDLLDKFVEFGSILKEYKVYEKYLDKYFIKGQ